MMVFSATTTGSCSNGKCTGNQETEAKNKVSQHDASYFAYVTVTVVVVVVVVVVFCKYFPEKHGSTEEVKKKRREGAGQVAEVARGVQEEDTFEIAAAA